MNKKVFTYRQEEQTSPADSNDDKAFADEGDGDVGEAKRGAISLIQLLDAALDQKNTAKTLTVEAAYEHVTALIAKVNKDAGVEGMPCDAAAVKQEYPLEMFTQDVVAKLQVKASEKLSMTDIERFFALMFKKSEIDEKQAEKP